MDERIRWTLNSELPQVSWRLPSSRDTAREKNSSGTGTVPVLKQILVLFSAVTWLIRMDVLAFVSLFIIFLCYVKVARKSALRANWSVRGHVATHCQLERSVVCHRGNRFREAFTTISEVELWRPPLCEVSPGLRHGSSRLGAHLHRRHFTVHIHGHALWTSEADTAVWIWISIPAFSRLSAEIKHGLPRIRRRPRWVPIRGKKTWMKSRWKADKGTALGQ